MIVRLSKYLRLECEFVLAFLILIVPSGLITFVLLLVALRKGVQLLKLSVWWDLLLLLKRSGLFNLILYLGFRESGGPGLGFEADYSSGCKPRGLKCAFLHSLLIENLLGLLSPGFFVLGPSL